MANEFKASVGSAMAKSEAQKWIDKYDKEVRKEKDKDTKSVFYGREILEKLLAQPGCAGISFFFGLKYSEHAKKDTVQLVLVGTREDGTLMWSDGAEGKDASNTMITADSGTSCPPYCPR